MDVVNRKYAELEKTPTLTYLQRKSGEKLDESVLTQNTRSIEYNNHKESIRLIEENFDCDTSKAQKINRFWNLPENSQLCDNCKLKWKDCQTCIAQVPNNRVRKLYVSLQNMGFKPEPKKRITQEGLRFNSDLPIDFDEILALPDLYIQAGNNKICLFLDRSSIPSKTQRRNHRNILMDHQLKKLGYVALRINPTELEDMNSLLARITKITFSRTPKPLSSRMQRLQTILG